MKKLKFYGVGGQGIVTAGKIFSIAVSLYEKKYAITIPAYGHERRGAPVYTDVVMDDKPILVNCFVANPDIVVVFDHTIDQKNIDVGKGINDQTILIINTSSSETAKRYKENYGFGDVYYTDATRISMDVIGITIPNATMLGALARTGIMSIESVNKAIIEFFGKKAGEINAKAADISFSQTKKYNALGPCANIFTSINTGSWRLERPEVNYSECVKCGICAMYCPANVITINKTEKECVQFMWDYCKGCGICANECPKSCIAMIEEKEGE